MKVQVEVPCDVLLIGFTADAPHARMGLFRKRPDFSASFQDHATRVKGTHCMERDCSNPIEYASPHGWTCTDHDWLKTANKGKK